MTFRRLAILLGLLAAAVYWFGLIADVMEIDAAQYAAMSREMSQTHGYLQVKHRGRNYLDKPPALFWASSASFQILGVGNVSYKLPSFLFSLLGLFSVFGFGRRLFDRKTGLIAAAMLACSQAFIYINNDVRTDTILAGAVIFAIWQFTEWLAEDRLVNLVLGAAGIAAAMLAKGPIGLMVPVLAIGSYMLWRRDARLLLRPHWITAFLVVALLLAPMLWGLYHQYGWRGWRFYFWTQSFGRITGESSWRDNSGGLFFVHTFLWAFLPWSCAAGYAAFDGIKRLWRDRMKRECAAEAMLLGGSILPFIALSFSHYKLPHYIFVFFPLVAVLTARFCIMIAGNVPGPGNRYRVFAWIQQSQSVLLWIFGFCLLTLVFPTGNPALWLAAFALCAATIVLMRKQPPLRTLIVPSMVAILGVNLLLNAHFFPHLLAYQANAVAGKRAESLHARIFGFKKGGHALDFYARRIVPMIMETGELRDSLDRGPALVYLTKEGLNEIREAGLKPAWVDSMESFKVSRATLKFLLASSRSKVLRWNFLAAFE